MASVARLLVKQTTASLSGHFLIPCSKYHAHRALILAALAPGQSRILGLSDAGHVRYTISALSALGATIDTDGDAFVVVGGPWSPKRREISVGSSGSTLYFLTGLASLAREPVRIVGQRYFRRRPIRPLLEALGQLGVRLRSTDGCPPIDVEPGPPSGGRCRISGMLSQWISGLLLLAPFATGPSVIEVEGPLNERSYIDLTVAMMRQFGLVVEADPDGRRFVVEGGQQAHPATVALPPDVGAAAFGLAATALHPSDVEFRNLAALAASEVDHPEADLLDIVSTMGLPMERDPHSGWVRVRHDGIELAPVEVDCRAVPDMLPVLSVLGSFAHGTTLLRNVAHVRLKESDRVAAMLQLNRMGARLEVHGDDLVCRGPSRLVGADLSSFNDHRVLMALAVAGTAAEGETRLTYPSAYRISYPRFLEEMANVGLQMSVERGRRSLGAVPALPPQAAKRPSSATIGEVAKRWALRRPGALALAEVDRGVSREWSWAELDREADRFAAALLALSVAPGEAVAFQLPNCGELVAGVLGALRIGARCCPLMPIFRARELGFILARSRARVLVVPAAFRGRCYPDEVRALAAGRRQHDEAAPLALEHVVVVGDDASAPVGLDEGLHWHRWDELGREQRVDHLALERRRPAPSDVVQLLFTSGTSGEPKGVNHRMDSLNRAVAMEVRHLGLDEDDRIFVPSPIAHQTGFLYGMWLAWWLGVPQVVQTRWDPEVAFWAIEHYGLTFVQAATPFLADLLQEVGRRGGRRPEPLRIFVATGATVPRALAERATSELGAAVLGAWGTTETGLGTLAAPGDEPARRFGTDGRALRGVHLRIVDDAGRQLGPGEEGELQVWSRTLFVGYEGRPDLTKAALTPDGWYRSGDLAVLDEAGFLQIRGRIKDIVNRGGEKIPVAEIEQLLHRHPSVGDVAIVAMPDERLGERACAFVVPRGRFDLAEAQRFLDAAGVAKPYWPERVELREALPLTPSGKVQKFLLREEIARIVRSEEEGKGVS